MELLIESDGLPELLTLGLLTVGLGCVCLALFIAWINKE